MEHIAKSVGEVMLFGPEDKVLELVKVLEDKDNTLDGFSATELRDAALGYMLVDLYRLADIESVAEFLLGPMFKAEELKAILRKLIDIAVADPYATFE